ncbi:MAG: NAD(P)-dependent malic enzyme, partial [Halanaerobiaceae bacterium]
MKKENLKKDALELHRKNQGKLMVKTKVPARNEYDLSLAYSPGVAEPCKEINQNKEKIYEYTNKSNFVAVVSDGSAVLGLGDIGAKASMPVMEGKAVLFKEFGGVDAFPVCLDESDPDKLIETVKRMAPVYGGINLEDIKSPKCFYIEKKLKQEIDIPVFHDDQHGTAIITLGGLINSLKIVNKKIENTRIIICGAGAAGVSIAKLLLAEGAEEIITLDAKGSIYEGRNGLNESKKELAAITNPKNEKGRLEDVIRGADIFIGVSVAEVMSGEMVKTMAEDPIIFAMANPVPEIWPETARKAGARI